MSIEFVIGFLAGGVIGTVFALFIAGESAIKKEQNAYMEGYLAGKNEVTKNESGRIS